MLENDSKKQTKGPRLKGQRIPRWMLGLGQERGRAMKKTKYCFDDELSC